VREIAALDLQVAHHGCEHQRAIGVSSSKRKAANTSATAAMMTAPNRTVQDHVLGENAADGVEFTGFDGRAKRGGCA
jgi:hypothetical protein